MEKQYSIREVANLLGITTNKIRFYEKKGLIKPTRGESNEYRYFNEEEIMSLHTILLYRRLGLSIEGIASLLKTTTKENYLEHFYQQWKVINDEIHELGQIRKVLEGIMDEMYLVTDGQYAPQVLKKIQDSVKKQDIKNSWKDQWAFENWAKDYDEAIKLDKGSLKIYKHYEQMLDGVVKEIREVINSRGPILDIGVGTGNLANKFYNLDYDIIGVDQSRAMLEVAKIKNPKLKVRLGEFMKLPFENKSFKAIVSTYAFHHLKEHEKELAMEEMIRVLSDEGILVIGDLMFENKEAKNQVYETLTPEEIQIIEDEYYTDISQLEEYIKPYHKALKKMQIDRLCWIVVIY